MPLLHLPQKSNRNCQNNILIKLIYTDYNPLLTADFDQFSGQTGQRAADDLYLVALGKFLSGNLYLGIAVDKQAEIVYLVLWDSHRLTFE